MKESIAKLKNSSFIKTLKEMLSSKYFPFLNAVMTLLCYYLGWDIVLIYYIVIAGSAIFILCDDLTPVISIFLFISIIVSAKNSPSIFNAGHDESAVSDYYFKPVIYIQIIILVALFICAGVYRLGLTIAKKKFTLNPNFFGLCAFCVTLLLNGIFSKNYDTKNIVFGLMLVFFFLGIYSLLKDNLTINKAFYEKLALAFFALSLVLILELFIAYITIDNLIVDGHINRDKLTFGWGIWNTMGMMLVLCIPAVTYLAIIKKYGFIYTLYSALLFVSVILSCSRQSIVGAFLIYPLCLIILLVKGKDRIANLSIIGCALVAGIILLIVFKDTVLQYFILLFKQIVVNGELDGSGRTQLWREAARYFRNNPFFGSGFFVHFSYQGDSGLGFIPLMCHNTFLQILSSCGLIGLAAYTLHRAQSVVSFCKNMTVDRAFIAITILTILVLSLFDNHLFNIFPTIIYSSLIAVLYSSEKI